MEEMITKLVNEGFLLEQIKEIETGMCAGVDVSFYEDKELLAIQMMQIRLGLCDGIDLSPFRYLDSEILKQLRLGLIHNVKLVSYIMEGYDAEQLEAIREAFEKKVDITPYLDKRMRGVCIREISKGIQHGLDVSVYAKPCYYWRQMREIRYGMEHMVDVGLYKNPYYRFDQMREIRLGLEEGLDVSYFNSLMYTAEDMKKRRLSLQKHPGMGMLPLLDVSKEEDASEGIRVTLAEDHTEAYVDLYGEIGDNLRVKIVKALHNLGIIYGIQYETIEQIAECQKPCEHIRVATGDLPQNGKNGYIFLLKYRKGIGRGYMYAQVEFGLYDKKQCISIILDNEEEVNECMVW